jgi:hypothetical protein
MAENTGTVRQLIGEGNALPEGGAKIAVFEEAVRMADVTSDIELGFAARSGLIHAAEFGGEPDKAIVAFAWCLAQCDAFPGRFDEWSTLWAYKWTARLLTNYPHVSRSRIDEVIDDLEARFIRFGAGPSAAAKLRWDSLRWLGDVAESREWLDRWRHLPRDFLSDCEACDIAESGSAMLQFGEFVDAMRTVKPILEGRKRCKEVPHWTYAELLVPLVDRGELDVAAEFHERGYPLIRRNPKFLAPMADHIAYLSLVGDHGGAKSLAERHLPWVVGSRNPLHRMLLLRSVELALTRIAALTPDASIRTPADFVTSATEGGRIYLATVRMQVRDDLDAVASAFDARNGNSFISGLVAEYRARAAPPASG